MLRLVEAELAALLDAIVTIEAEGLGCLAGYLASCMDLSRLPPPNRVIELHNFSAST